MTNLLQPADLSWFAPIKKAYRKEWNHWFTYDRKTYTTQKNMKSPGYVLCSNWLSKIWTDMPAEIIKDSFVYCGISKDHQISQSEEIEIKLDNLHRVLKKMLMDKLIIQQDLGSDIELDEAQSFMCETGDDLFGQGDADLEPEDIEIENCVLDLNLGPEEMLRFEAIEEAHRIGLTLNGPASQFEIERYHLPEFVTIRTENVNLEEETNPTFLRLEPV